MVKQPTICSDNAPLLTKVTLAQSKTGEEIYLVLETHVDNVTRKNKSTKSYDARKKHLI